MLFNRKLLANHRNYAAEFIQDPLYSKIWQEGADLLVDAIEIMPILPSNILELGARCGTFTTELVKYYPNSTLTICDLSNKMLELNPSLNKLLLDEDFQLNNLAEKFDLIASNVNLHFINDPLKFLSEVKGLLSNKGIFIATCFAESCLHNFRKALIKMESDIGSKHYNRIIPFIRASDLSQMLLNLGFKNVIVNVNKFDIENISCIDLAKYIKNIGEGNILTNMHNFTISKELYKYLNTAISDHYFIVSIIASN